MKRRQIRSVIRSGNLEFDSHSRCSENWALSSVRPGLSEYLKIIANVSILPRLVRRLSRDEEGDATMRFILIRKADKDTEAGILPSKEFMTAMLKYNQELAEAGVMLQGE